MVLLFVRSRVAVWAAQRRCRRCCFPFALILLSLPADFEIFSPANANHAFLFQYLTPVLVL